MLMVRALNAATKEIQKHGYGGLICSQHIFANTKGLCFLHNFDFVKETEQMWKSLEGKREKARTDMRNILEELDRKPAMMEDWKITMPPLEAAAIEKRRRLFTDYRKWMARGSVDREEEPIVTENHTDYHGDIIIDLPLIRYWHIDDPDWHTFYELYGITHITAQFYLGIYSAPMQLLYVY